MYGYKPEMSTNEIKASLRDDRKRFLKSLQQCNLSFNELVERGERYYRNLFGGNPAAPAEEWSLSSVGPFVLYIKAWQDELGEDEDMHRARMAVNQYRHSVTDYDKAFSRYYDYFWMPEDFSMTLWNCVMHAIDKYLADNMDKVGINDDDLKAVRRSYTQLSDIRYVYFMCGRNIDPEMRDLVSIKDDTRSQEECLQAVNERYARYIYLQHKEEIEEAKREQEELKAQRKEFFNTRSKMSRLVTKYLRKVKDVNALGLEVKYSGRVYPAHIDKINPVNIEWTITLKNGQSRSGSTQACYLYEHNRERIGDIAGFEMPQWNSNWQYDGCSGW